ncbi:hypothetical protein G6045_23500 [Streptomyces sp. YC504]|uniref:Uncharacterized protein n=1 Tax=Streptomyces mesophilus TaxID=1775132 RepID=A0A6G4XP49_9ACTN|nr:hypothetical protein [Streptomyces mesophilus]NGO78597.1 hypothetical protein [Streptomyces mesophilus]
MRHILRMIALVSIVTVALTAAIFANRQTDTEATAQAKPEEITIAHGSDRRPSETATDWVTYADHVVVVTPVSEKEIAPAQTELQRGEGLLLRNVELRVGDVLWSRPGATTAPSAFAWTAYGWHFKDGSTANRIKMAGEGDSRLELGHTYVMAIQWEPARCSEGDSVPAGWRGLGTGSTMPFDGGVLGQGESEGKNQSATQARALADTSSGVLEEQMAGRTATDLARVLDSAQPVAPQQFGPAARSSAACE